MSTGESDYNETVICGIYTATPFGSPREALVISELLAVLAAGKPTACPYTADNSLVVVALLYETRTQNVTSESLGTRLLKTGASSDTSEILRDLRSKIH